MCILVSEMYEENRLRNVKLRDKELAVSVRNVLQVGNVSVRIRQEHRQSTNRNTKNRTSEDRMVRELDEVETTEARGNVVSLDEVRHRVFEALTKEELLMRKWKRAKERHVQAMKYFERLRQAWCSAEDARVLTIIDRIRYRQAVKHRNRFVRNLVKSLLPVIKRIEATKVNVYVEWTDYWLSFKVTKVEFVTPRGVIVAVNDGCDEAPKGAETHNKSLENKVENKC